MKQTKTKTTKLGLSLVFYDFTALYVWIIIMLHTITITYTQIQLEISWVLFVNADHVMVVMTFRVYYIIKKNILPNNYMYSGN